MDDGTVDWQRSRGPAGLIRWFRENRLTAGRASCRLRLRSCPVWCIDGPPEIAKRADSDPSLRAVRCCFMSREKSSANVQPRPYPASPEAIEFARSGRVDNRPTNSEQREQRLVKQVLLLLLGAAVVAALVISYA